MWGQSEGGKKTPPKKWSPQPPKTKAQKRENKVSFVPGGGGGGKGKKKRKKNTNKNGCWTKTEAMPKGGDQRCPKTKKITQKTESSTGAKKDGTLQKKKTTVEHLQTMATLTKPNTGGEHTRQWVETDGNGGGE